MWEEAAPWRRQLAKVAEAQALRMAFPEFSASHTMEEMQGKTGADDWAGPTIEAEAPQPPPDRRLSLMALAEVDAARRKALNDSIPLKAAAAATPRAPRKADPVVYEDAPDPLDETDGRQWLLNLDVALANAQSQDEVVAIGGHASRATPRHQSPSTSSGV